MCLVQVKFVYKMFLTLYIVSEQFGGLPSSYHHRGRRGLTTERTKVGPMRSHVRVISSSGNHSNVPEQMGNFTECV